MPLVRPSLRGPPSLAVNDVRGLVGTQAPQSRAVNLFSEETKSSPLATYVALCEGMWIVRRSDFSPYLFESAHTWLDKRLGLIAACAPSFTLTLSKTRASPLFHHFTYSFFDHSLFSSNALASPSSKLRTSNLLRSKGMIFMHWLLLSCDFAAHNMQ